MTLSGSVVAKPIQELQQLLDKLQQRVKAGSVTMCASSMM